MTDSEKLDLALSKLDKLDILESDIHGLKQDMQGMKQEMHGMQQDIQEIKRRTTNLELHIENVTDKNIQLIAENFVELAKKLNKVIPAADKNLAYEVKVNYLVCEIDKIKKEIEEIKNKIA